MYNIEELEVRLLSELKEIAEQLSIPNVKKLQKKELIYKILDQQAVLPDTQLPEKKSTMAIEKNDDSLNDAKGGEARKRTRVKRENVKQSEPDADEFSVSGGEFGYESFPKEEEFNISFDAPSSTTSASES